MRSVFRAVVTWRFALALVVAIVLWVRLTIDQNPEREDLYPTDIPIEVRGLAPTLLVANETGAVRVRISAPEDSWRRLQASSFRATIDLNQAGPGLQQREVMVECSDPDVRLVSHSPPKVAVRVEETRTVEIPVRVNELGTVPFGFRVVGPPLVTPDRITVSGPASAIEKVTEAFVSVRMEELKSTVERSLKPEPRGASGAVSSVRIEPQAVTVTVQVEQIAGSKVVPVVPVVRGQPSSGHWLSGVVVDPLTVQIVGEPGLLEALTVLSTQEIDISGAQGDQVRTVAIVRPAGVSLVRDVPASVRVIVSALPGQQTREVVVTPVGGSGVVLPSVVTITLVGTQPLLQRVATGDVLATVDVTGLVPGTYVLPVTVAPLEGVRIERIDPQTASVTIAAVSEGLPGDGALPGGTR